MKHLLLRSAARALFRGGSNHHPHFSTAAIVEPRYQHGGYAYGSFYWRKMSTLPETKDQQSEENKNKDSNNNNNAVVSSYWGIARPKVQREDGTEWPWNCFMPWDTYQADISIDVTKHHVPKSFSDKFAFKTVKFLRVLSDFYFKERYGCHAMMLETIAGVPGMVGGMLLHLKSLRKFQHSGDWIKALLEEAENERIHLMTMVELVKPSWHERLLFITAQGFWAVLCVRSVLL